MCILCFLQAYVSVSVVSDEGVYFCVSVVSEKHMYVCLMRVCVCGF